MFSINVILLNNYFWTASNAPCSRLGDIIASTTIIAYVCIAEVIAFLKGVVIAIEPADFAG